MAIVADAGVPVFDDGSEQSVKVTSVNDVELEDGVVNALTELANSNKSILKQLQLLNARFEEAFDTKIEVTDL